MKLFLPFLFFLYATQVSSQEPVVNTVNIQSIKILKQIADQYCKANPYSKNFSSFLNEIVTDSDINDRQVFKRTDSAFFYASGTYKNFKPLIYLPSALKIIVSESTFPLNDSATAVDTVIYYQLLLSTDSTEKGKRFVQKEYERILKKHKQFKADIYPLSSGIGAAAVCFLAPYAVAPLTIGWGYNTTEKVHVLSITFCLKVRNNRASMVLLPAEYYLREE